MISKLHTGKENTTNPPRWSDLRGRAPRDGERAVLWTPGKGCNVASWDGERKRWTSLVDGAAVNGPTHWCPCPDPVPARPGEDSAWDEANQRWTAPAPIAPPPLRTGSPDELIKLAEELLEAARAARTVRPKRPEE